ncbi:MAG TPA: ABC transporter permease [Arenimonas sp.]|nr:ABC transporter permease [Arenimonas sp.]
MNKTLQIAWREFLATVMTKGFLIGMLMLPLMIGLAAVMIPWLVKQEKRIDFVGEVLVIDPSGAVAPALRAYLAPEAFAERRREIERRVEAMMPGGVKAIAGNDAITQAAMQQGLSQTLGDVPQLTVIELPVDADVDQEKATLFAGRDAKGGRVALVRIHDDALPREDDAGGKLGGYDFFIRDKTDDRVVDELRNAIKQAIIEARMGSRQLDAAEIRRLTQVPTVPARKIGEQGEKSGSEIAARIMPMAFMMLIFIAVLTAGQHLMTSTIEEKSSRVVEVLLAAVSPMQLMAGKIIGQGAVAMLMLAVYGGLGILGLMSLAAIGLLDPMQLVYLLVFFLIAFITIAALMAAIGAAVNEMREAQTLLTPIMLVLVMPMMFWMPISRDPNGTLATVLSLIPPVSPLVMVLRLSSSSPPPEWQIALSIAIGIAGVFAAVWLAGKVFRIGLLMHGKAPNLATLWRWVRMA